MFAALPVNAMLWMMKRYDPYDCKLEFVRQNECTCACHVTHNRPERGLVVRFRFQLGQDVNWNTGCFSAMSGEPLPDCPVSGAQVYVGSANDEESNMKEWSQMGRLSFPEAWTFRESALLRKSPLLSPWNENEAIKDIRCAVVCCAKNRISYRYLATSIASSLEKFIFNDLLAFRERMTPVRFKDKSVTRSGWRWDAPVIRDEHMNAGRINRLQRSVPILVLAECHPSPTTRASRWCEHDVAFGDTQVVVRMRTPDIVFLLPPSYNNAAERDLLSHLSTLDFYDRELLPFSVFE